MSFFQILKDFRSTSPARNRIACVESAQCHGVESDGRAAGNPRSRVAAAESMDGLWMVYGCLWQLWHWAGLPLVYLVYHTKIHELDAAIHNFYSTKTY